MKGSATAEAREAGAIGAEDDGACCGAGAGVDRPQPLAANANANTAGPPSMRCVMERAMAESFTILRVNAMG